MELPQYNGDILTLFYRPCNCCPCKRLEVLLPITECLECGHEQGNHKSPEELLPGILEKMVLLGKTNNQILRYLHLHGIELSLRTLKRRLQTYGISRTVDLQPSTVINFVKLAQDSTNKKAGYRRLHRVIRQEYNIPIKRDDVMMVAKALDPDGSKERLNKKCQRRVFHSPGPDDTWSIDGHDKLASFGIYIHGCIDAFSRKVLWCSTYTSNKNPLVVAKWFTDTVQQLKVVPRKARFDPGSENTISVELQMFLRRNGADVVHAEEKAIILHKSKFNQKIECFWSGLYDKVTLVYHEKFTGMARMGLIEDPQHQEAFIYVYLPIVKSDIDAYVSWWNNHRIRKQKGVALPTGHCPDDMYYMPDLYDAVNCGFQYNHDDMAAATDYHEIPSQLSDIVSDEFQQQADKFLLDNGLCLSKETADTIFTALCK